MSNKLIFIVVLVIFAGFGIGMVNISNKDEVRVLFPEIIGDAILDSNETGIYFVRSIVLYDDFRGDVVQGYKATYSGGNGTMIIFMAKMRDNESAYDSLKDMVIRDGYNQIGFNETIGDNNFNITLPIDNVTRLPVKNPEVYMIQKNKNSTWHYTFTKLDKVYWIGFNNSDIQYQIDMLIATYRNVDKGKGEDII